MELYQEILTNVLTKQEIHIVFPNLELNAAQIVEGICYKALREIKAILDDDSLDDKECFSRIEDIVCALEEIGSSGGCRHDFG